MLSLSSKPPSPVLDALGALAPQSRSLTWRKMSGGRTNSAWHGAGQGGDIVVKLYSGPSQNPLFPNDPKAEARLLTHLAPHHLAPDLLGAFKTDLGPCIVYRHVPGSPWTAQTAKVAGLMRQLHRLAPPASLRRSANGSAALTQQTRDILAKCQSPMTLAELRPRHDVPATPETVLLHADIVPGNLISGPSGLRLIDWQCPAIGDPCEDIAIFLSPAMQQVYRGTTLTPAEVGQFLDAYDEADVTARYRALAPFYHWRMAAYCLWQIQQGRGEYRQGLALERDAMRRAGTDQA